MAIPTHYSFADADAPDFRTLYGDQALPQFLKTILVDGYGLKPGIGWTLTHDTITGTTDGVGMMIFTHPSNTYCFWIEWNGTRYYTLGLAEAGFSDGTMIGKTSNLDNPASPSTTQQKTGPEGVAFLDWAAIGTQDTIIFVAGQLTTWGASPSSSDSRSCHIYLGAYKDRRTGLDPQASVCLLAGSPNATNVSSGRFEFSTSTYTTLRGLNGNVPTAGVSCSIFHNFTSRTSWYNSSYNTGLPPYVDQTKLRFGISDETAYQNYSAWNNYPFSVGELYGMFGCEDWDYYAVRDILLEENPTWSTERPGSPGQSHNGYDIVPVFCYGDSPFFVTTDPTYWS